MPAHAPLTGSCRCVGSQELSALEAPPFFSTAMFPASRLRRHRLLTAVPMTSRCTFGTMLDCSSGGFPSSTLPAVGNLLPTKTAQSSSSVTAKSTIIATSDPSCKAAIVSGLAQIVKLFLICMRILALSMFIGLMGYSPRHCLIRGEESYSWCVIDFGVKPLFYYHNRGLLVFGSEIKAVLAHPDVPREFDWKTALMFRRTMHYPCPERDLTSFFVGINQLPAGHLIEVDLQTGKLRRHSYWDPRAAQSIGDPGPLRADDMLSTTARFLATPWTCN